MARREKTAWWRSIIARVGVLVAGVLLVSALVAVNNLRGLRALRGDAAAMNLAGAGRALAYRLLYVSSRLSHPPTAEARATLLEDLRATRRDMDHRFAVLLGGDPAIGIAPATDARPVVTRNQAFWGARIVPVLAKLETASSSAEAEASLAELEPLLLQLVVMIEDTVRAVQQSSEAKITRSMTLAIASVAVLGVLTGLLVWIAFVGRRRLRSLMQTARRIADGDLTSRTPVVGRDEIAALASAFNEMADSVAALVTARDDFVAIASHELRSPLSALTLGLQVLRQSVASLEPRMAVTVDRAIRQTDRLTALIGNLLDMSQITAGRIDLHRGEVDLAALIGAVADRLGDEAARAGCHIVVSPGPAVVGDWDAARIEQVLKNLLSNAIKYAPGRPVEVSVVADPALATVRVRDHGPGIPPEHRTRIFERFERGGADADLARTAGTGLGLFITRKIVEAHGGTIRVESESGAGATFVVELPHRSVDQGVAQEPHVTS